MKQIKNGFLPTRSNRIKFNQPIRKRSYSFLMTSAIFIWGGWEKNWTTHREMGVLKKGQHKQVKPNQPKASFIEEELFHVSYLQPLQGFHWKRATRALQQSILSEICSLLQATQPVPCLDFRSNPHKRQVWPLLSLTNPGIYFET